ncbi:MAG: hypothetical protein KDD43_04740 [Bdellovibrionales bacterium]|nr:hypothetical protein [Bdellovibrionales bacterium]
MTRIAAVLIAGFLIAGFQPAYADPLGIGVVIGSPIGFAGNYYLNKRNSIDGVISPDFGADGGMYLHSTYLWHYQGVLNIDKLPIHGYWGLGLRLRIIDKFEDELRLGPRLSGGLLYRVRSAPVDFFFEVAIVVDLIEKTGLAGNLGIGARYYF